MRRVSAASPAPARRWTMAARRAALRAHWGHMARSPEYRELVRPDCVVMHPLPRVNELPDVWEDHPGFVVWRQVRNGMWIRAALLAQADQRHVAHRPLGQQAVDPRGLQITEDDDERLDATAAAQALSAVTSSGGSDAAGARREVGARHALPGEDDDSDDDDIDDDGSNWFT